MAETQDYIRWFETLGVDDIPLVGGKNASLGEMFRSLKSEDIPVPDGFAITARAYSDLIEANKLADALHGLLHNLDKHNVGELSRCGREARELIYQAEFTADLTDQILSAYHELMQRCGPDTTVAIRSSATAEDLPGASFAGQQETYLNVSGDSVLLDMCHRCFASLFTDRAISYRMDHGFDHFDVSLSIAVQKMVRADLATSGVMFTLDTDSGFRDVVFITGAYGLGENVVQGTVDPDEYFVHKPTLKQGYASVVKHRLGAKAVKMVYSSDVTKDRVRNMPVSKAEQNRFCLSDEDVVTLARYACVIEDHYSKLAGQYRPMDIEWAKDGIDGKLYIVQARPETVVSRQSTHVLEDYRLKQQSEVVLTGRAVGKRIATGKACVIPDVARLEDFVPGDVLVTDITTPDWEPVMKRAAAIVTNRGGRTCHAAIVARELGIPAVVGTGDGTDVLKKGQPLTVSCAEGEEGRVYDGILEYELKQTNLDTIKKPQTRLMLNLADPDQAFSLQSLPCEGVGLARLEFIITNAIGVHPMALLHTDRVNSGSIRQVIADKTCGYDSPEDFFVMKLSEGIAQIAAAFYPRDVVVRLSDFKSNEYRNLLGGEFFEPHEENPMLGLRGAARYLHPRHAHEFKMECTALRRVRDELGLVNVIPMIPFCRTVKEGKAVRDLMAKHGLVQGENGLKLYLMCEIPSNVILLEMFATVFDGFSIGSNDLTQLVLAADRDSGAFGEGYDERNAAVMQMIELAVSKAIHAGRPIGICGQAPSDFPGFAEHLQEIGINSISLNPDSILPTLVRLAY